jgi:hypothetical protein
VTAIHDGDYPGANLTVEKAQKKWYSIEEAAKAYHAAVQKDGPGAVRIPHIFT